MSGVEGCGCRVEGYTASLLPACGSSTTCSAPWEPFMGGSCATTLSWTVFGSTGWQRSQPVWEGHCSRLLGLVQSWSWLSSLHPACSDFCSSAVGAVVIYTCSEQLGKVPRLFEWPGVLLSVLGLMKALVLACRGERMSGHLNLDPYLADLCNLITRILSLIVCSWLLIAFQAEVLIYGRWINQSFISDNALKWVE